MNRGAGSLPFGASLLETYESASEPPVAAGRGWVLDDEGSVNAFGAALAWARLHRVQELHVLVDGRAVAPGGKGAGGGESAGGEGGPDRQGRLGVGPASIIARRARAWGQPPYIWTVNGRKVDPAVSAPVLPIIEPPAAARAWIPLLREHGVDVVVEHGVITGEILGLEVARVVPVPPASWGGRQDQDLGPGADPFDGSGDGCWRLSVGVGRHDREARDEMRPDEPVESALERVVTLVRQLRAVGATHHPANTLARERWLRSVIVAKPEVIGARILHPVEPPLPRGDLRCPAPAAAIGEGSDGRPLVAVCSVGLDLDLVPTAADVRLIHGRLLHNGLIDGNAVRADAGQPDTGQPDAVRLVLVLPVADDHRITRLLAEDLAVPAEVITLPANWASLAD